VGGEEEEEELSGSGAPAAARAAASESGEDDESFLLARAAAAAAAVVEEELEEEELEEVPPQHPLLAGGSSAPDAMLHPPTTIVSRTTNSCATFGCAAPAPSRGGIEKALVDDDDDVEAAAEAAAAASIGLLAANTATALPSISSPRNSAPPPGGLRVSSPDTRTWSVGSLRALITACAGWTGGGAGAGEGASGGSGGGDEGGTWFLSADAVASRFGGFGVFFLRGAGACTGASSALIAFQSAETDTPSATSSRGSTSAVARASKIVVERFALATAKSSSSIEGGWWSVDISAPLRWPDSCSLRPRLEEEACRVRCGWGGARERGSGVRAGGGNARGTFLFKCGSGK